MTKGARLQARSDSRSGAWKTGDLATFVGGHRPAVELDRERLFAVKTIGFESEAAIEKAFEEVRTGGRRAATGGARRR